VQLAPTAKTSPPCLAKTTASPFVWPSSILPSGSSVAAMPVAKSGPLSSLGALMNVFYRVPLIGKSARRVT
jgi:hypothetical protein